MDRGLLVLLAAGAAWAAPLTEVIGIRLNETALSAIETVTLLGKKVNIGFGITCALPGICGKVVINATPTSKFGPKRASCSAKKILPLVSNGFLIG